VLSRARGALRRLKRIVEGRLHPRRRRAALAARGHPASVASAGFSRPGRPSPPTARAAAARRDVDLAGHRLRVLPAEETTSADLVLVMSPGQRRRVLRDSGARPERTVVLGDLDPRDADRRAIIDPFDRPEEVFDEVYARIDRCCRALAAALAEGSRG